MQMSVSHSVPKYMLIMYYEILIIRQEKERAVFALSFFLYFFSITNVFNFKDFIYFLFVCIITDKIMVKINISIVVKIIILLF